MDDDRGCDVGVGAVGEGVHLVRFFSTEGQDPYDSVAWGTVDVVQTDRAGEEIFRQDNVEFPSDWDHDAVTIVTTRYFHGAVGSPQRERSLRQLVSRVVSTYRRWGVDNGYFSDIASADVFADELTWLLIHQYFSFNSPVWFNVGTAESNQVSACFLLSVDDDMDSILNWYREEGKIFKAGSGAGINLSSIRGACEELSSGGHASGPVSFMRGADASAGSIRSGGKTRRAAKLVCLDVDHPDIEEFIWCKAKEERKIRALSDAGFDMDLGGEDIFSVQYQNGNNSVQVSDAFMKAYENHERFGLRARTTGDDVQDVDARSLFHDIAQASWECADPGVQFSDTINAWNTVSASGRITTSNPCGEFVFQDNTSCNLASLNLLKFLKGSDRFDVEAFTEAINVVLLAMDISVAGGDFPTPLITERSKGFRPLGLGFSNLGALLMVCGLPYDSEEGRALSASIASLMSACAYRMSAQMAKAMGPYSQFGVNRQSQLSVIGRHAKAAERIPAFSAMDTDIAEKAGSEWAAAVDMSHAFGVRNAQVTLLAPTGTISFMMGCTTTSAEPGFSLVTYKKLADGGSMTLVNQVVGEALRNLGYGDRDISDIEAYVLDRGTMVGAPGVDPSHYPVFDCAVGERSIDPMGHVLMLKELQPMLSGAISKTVNMPASASVDDIESIYYRAWKLGVKSITVYRDGCKAHQPLSASKAKTDGTQPCVPTRRRLPQVRAATTRSFTLGGTKGYLTQGHYDDGGLGEVFIQLGKQGSTMSGVLSALSIVVSIALQYGVPLDSLVEKFVGQSFSPNGITDDPDIRMSSSLVDYIFRRLGIDNLSEEDREALGILTARERADRLDDSNGHGGDDVSEASGEPDTFGVGDGWGDIPMCSVCGQPMTRSGVCWACPACGATTGCS